MEKIGVIGMGTMGSQIGLVFAGGSFQTIMVDRGSTFFDGISYIYERREELGI